MMGEYGRNLDKNIAEEDFLDCSYEFRPKKNAHQALKILNDLIMFQSVSHIVEAEKKDFSTAHLTQQQISKIENAEMFINY